MLTIKEARFKDNLASVLLLTVGSQPMPEVLAAVKATIQERFRCGDSPREGRSPMLGKVVFIKTGDAALHPAALAALSQELVGLFDATCVQVSPDEYVVATLNEGSRCGCKLGEVISVFDVKEHADPWSTE
jgi:hypothetical protein